MYTIPVGVFIFIEKPIVISHFSIQIVGRFFHWILTFFAVVIVTAVFLH